MGSQNQNQLMVAQPFNNSSLQAGQGMPLDAPQTIDQITSGQPGNNANFLNLILPTLGAVGGDLLGGPLLGAAGASGGQYLSDLFSGKKPGWDVAGQGALAGITGGLGRGLSGLLGGGLTGAGEGLATGGLNLTKRGLAKFTLENGGEDAISLLGRTGLTGVDQEGLQAGISNLSDAMHTISGRTDLPVDENILLNNLQKSTSGLAGETPGASKKMAGNIFDEFKQNILPKFGINTTAAGDTAIGDNPMSMKGLSDMVREYDGQTTNAQFGKDPAQWDTYRHVGDILRDTRNEMADLHGLTTDSGQSLSQTGQSLKSLINLNNAAKNRVGMASGINPFGLTNLLGEDVTSRLAQSAGGSPLLGLLFPGVRSVGRLAMQGLRSSPELAGAVAQGLTKAGGVISKAAPFVGAAGAGASTYGLSNVLNPSGDQSSGSIPSITSNPQIEGNNQQNNNNNPQGNQPSFLSGNVPQVAQNSNTQQGLMPGMGGEGAIQSFDGKSAFPAQLPNPSQMQTTIPGQPFGPEQQQAELKSIEQDRQNAYGNSMAMEYVNGRLQDYQAKVGLNDRHVANYISQSGLNENDKDFVKTANPQWNSLTQLHSLLQTNGGKDLFSSFLQADPTVQTVLASKDPRYAVMFNLLGQQKLAQARLAQGGVPRAYDLALSRLGAGQTAGANSAILEYAMKQFLTQYQQYAPLYGLSLQQQPQGVQGGGSSYQGMFPIQSAQAPQPSPTQQVGALFQTLGLPQ